MTYIVEPDVVKEAFGVQLCSMIAEIINRPEPPYSSSSSTFVFSNPRSLAIYKRIWNEREREKEEVKKRTRERNRKREGKGKIYEEGRWERGINIYISKGGMECIYVLKRERVTEYKRKEPMKLSILYII